MLVSRQHMFEIQTEVDLAPERFCGLNHFDFIRGDTFQKGVTSFPKFSIN